MPYETIVGRSREELAKFGSIACGYIGKHIVGTGEEAHLTVKVFLDLLKPHVILVCGKRGTGKCVTGDTLIHLSDGRLKPIQEIVENKREVEVLSLDQENFLVKKSKATCFFEREVDKVIEIKLWNGFKIKVTENHPLLTPFGWKEAKDVKVNDYIALPSKIEISGNKRMEEEKLKILACLLSEGIIGGNFIWFTNSREEIVKEFVDAVKRFDKTLEVRKCGKMTYRVVGTNPLIETKNLKFSSRGLFAKGTKIIVRRNSLLKWLSSLGLKNKRSEERFIPQAIFSLSTEDIALFLKYLFAGDGSLYKKKTRGIRKSYIIEYCSKSKVLAEQICNLLIRFGIFSYIREKKVKGVPYYRVLITNKRAVEEFLRQIGWLGKEELVKEILNDKRKFHSNYDVLPKEIWKYIRRYRKKDIGNSLGYKNYKGVSTKYRYNPLKSTVRKIGEFFNDKYLIKISSPEINWIKVMEMNEIKGPIKVYDITVNDHHNFIGNGVILHNSYSAGVILEEFLLLPEEYRNKMSFLVIDPMGIYWSMKYPNEQQRELLREWKLEPRGFEENVKIYVPLQLLEAYKAVKIPVDGTISIAPSEITPSEWFLAFGLKPIEPPAITFEKNYSLIAKKKKDFSLGDLVQSIKADEEASEETKAALISLLRVAESWGIFSEKGFKIEELVEPGKIIIVDVSRMPALEVRNLLVGLIARKIYDARVASRKEEEIARIEGREPKFSFPITWLVLEEAHNFAPADMEVASSDPILTLARQGREPGIALVCITQMPNKIHSDILAQCDLVISFRLTAESDIEALHAVMQTYVEEELLKFINRLPRGWIGSAIILDDVLEKIFTLQIRPRVSWHAGGTAALI